MMSAQNTHVIPVSVLRFSLILYLNKRNYSRISDLWILCALQVKRVVFGIILELKKKKEKKNGSKVATCQRRDVPTS